MKSALITGVLGQDGSYLAKLLIDKGYLVYGSHRATSNPAMWRLEAHGILRHPNLKLVPLELLETTNVLKVVEKCRPDEIYNLAAQCSLTVSRDMPEYTSQADGLGVLRLLEAIKEVNRKIKFFQASSSEMFGSVTESPQDEFTPFRPRNPYGVAKLYAHWMVAHYRQEYGIHASTGIFYNHESPLRAREFLSRKVVSMLVDLQRGKIDHFQVGNLDTYRDWGFSGDYVEAAWKMLQEPEGDDYVIATGKPHTVRDFIRMVGYHLGEEFDWHGVGFSTFATNSKGKTIITIDQGLYRPAENPILCGDPTKAEKVLGWSPKVAFTDLVRMMVEAELAR